MSNPFIGYLNVNTTPDKVNKPLLTLCLILSVV